MTLEEARKIIDRADEQLFAAFRERMEASAEIAAWKEANGLPVRDPLREAQKLSDTRGRFSPPLDIYAEKLCKALFDLSSSYQEDLRFSEAHPRGKGLRCGLLGKSLTHSYSPKLHELLGDYSYSLFEIAEEDLPHFMEMRDFDGINVTVPYKKAVLPFLRGISPAAEAIGSVNVVTKREDGSLFGDNTDWAGFVDLLEASRISPAGKKVLVLGSGGSSLAVQYGLRRLGVTDLTVISRSGENNYRNLQKHQNAEIIVNTTPVGMYPNSGEAPLSLTAFPKLLAVYDIIYNPAKTALIQEAEALGIPGYNGLRMLAEQARLSAALFCRKPIDPALTEKLLEAIL